MGFDEMEGKMIGLVGVSGGALGAVHVLNSLRTVGRVLHAWVRPEQASIPEAYKAFDQSGALQDSGLEKRLKEAVRGCLDWKYLLCLELDDPGFDYPVLCEFRVRLLASGAERRLLEQLLVALQAYKLAKARGQDLF